MKHYWRLFTTTVILLSLLTGVVGKPQTTLAAFVDINKYFSYSYTCVYYKADKQTPLDYARSGETFYVRVNGEATCRLDPPVPGIITSAVVAIKIVARFEGSEIILNPRFALTYSPFPRQGQTVSDSRDVQLVFPNGSVTGAYSVFGQVLEATLMIAGIIPYNAIELLPPAEREKSMGSVGYGVSAPSGGGGTSGAGITGGGGATESLIEPITYLTSLFFPDGTLKNNALAKSLDGKVVLNLLKGMRITDPNGDTVSAIVMFEVKKENEPKPPEGSLIIGKVYDLRPEGTTFSKPIEIVLSFDPASLPERVLKKDIVIAWWNSVEEKWVSLTDCKVDEEANTVTGTINHFTVFTLIAKPVPLPPAPTTTPTYTLPSTTPATTPPTAPTTTQSTIPATTTTPTSSISIPASSSFALSGLTITPDEIRVGENISVDVLVTNTGDLAGDYVVGLKLDNITIQTKQVTLGSKASQTVNFTVTGNTAGMHTISIGEIPGTFVVKEGPSQSAQPPVRKNNWWLIGALIAVGLIMGVTGFILKRQKPWQKN